MIGFSLSPEQMDLIMMTREMVEEKVIPFALQMDACGHEGFDWSYMQLLAADKLLAPNIPKEFGGRELDFLTIALLIEEIARGCAGMAACIVGGIHATIPLIIGGDRNLQNKLLPRLVDKQAALAAFALTEPYGGSDVSKLNTTYRYQDGVLVVNGVKNYTINGMVADFITVCTSAESDHGRSSFRFVVVPRDQVKRAQAKKMMGIKYSNIAELTFQNSRTEVENIIGNDGSGYLLLSQTLDTGRALIAAIQVGIARAAYEMVLDFAQNHEQFGRPIFSNQGVAFPLVEMATMIDAARFMVWRACWLIDNNEDFSKASSMAKICASQVAHKVTSEAVSLMGARGYADDSLVNVYFRDAKAGSIVGGTDNVQRMIVASLL